MGKGFPIASVPPEEVDRVLIFATGTGIGPIKALIESGALEADKRKEVRLYFGCTDNDSTPYKELCAFCRLSPVRIDAASGFVECLQISVLFQSTKSMEATHFCWVIHNA
jgi:predicted ferric reductase